MPYITVRSVAPLTAGNDTAYSRVGHAWVEISGSQVSPDGTPESYGFYPEVSSPYAPGEVRRSDYDDFVGFGSTSQAFYITEDQAQALRNFAAQVDATGTYDLLPGLFGSNHNCASFAFEAMHTAGVNTGLPIRNVLPWWIPGQFDPTTGNLMELEIGIDPAAFAAAHNIAPGLKDPLTLDLDNNGLDTTGIDPNAPILFDHDADGIKTATGWIRASDAFVVLDRNGNGTIDNGSELFGDSTPLYAGGLAADGFAALAQEDNDFLMAEAGNDVLYVGGGEDLLEGGAGNDKSRRWRDGERSAFSTAANGAMFAIRRVR